MKIPETPKRSDAENTLPMINVVFLLLIFFMLAGAFKRPEPISVNLPVAAELKDIKRETYLLLINAEGKLAFNDTEVTLDTLSVIIQKHQETLQNQGIQVKADAELDAQQLMDVIEVFASHGISSVHLMADHG